MDMEPRVFEVLLYLVKNRDRAVDKGELQDAIWPGVFVTETALTRAVMKARKAVDDDASRQKMIKTLHGHGYRFIARLDETPAPSTEVSTATGKPAEEPLARGSRAKNKLDLRLVTLTSIAAVAVLVLAWIFLRPEATDQGDQTLIAVLPLKDNTGNPELSWTRFGLMS